MADAPLVTEEPAAQHSSLGGVAPQPAHIAVGEVDVSLQAALPAAAQTSPDVAAPQEGPVADAPLDTEEPAAQHSSPGGVAPQPDQVTCSISTGAPETLRDCTPEEAMRLHVTLMHAGWETVSRAFGVRIPKPMPVCEVCKLTRSKRVHHSGHNIVSTQAGQMTHSDTWGPFMSALYYTGCRYAVVFKDDYSRLVFFVFCKDRTTTTLLEAYKLYAAFMRSHGVELSGTWVSDGGPEYVSREAYDFCDDHALQRLLSVRYTPQQNGGAESAFLVHVPLARAALRSGGLPKQAWALALQYSAWLSNRTQSKRLGCAPLQRLPNPPALDLHHARPMGCRVWAHQPSVHVEGAMDDTSRAGIFVGLS